MDAGLMKVITTLLYFLMVLLFSCDHKNEVPLSTTSEPITIDIQPFYGVSHTNVAFIYNELKKIYPKISMNKPIALPKNAYYKQRNRYKADSIIQFLRSVTPKGHVTIGLTDKDISRTKGTTSDYGIMGLGYQPGSSCVVSTFRLSKENLPEQYFKLSIHELGHTQGLPHCPVKTCFMRDAQGKNHTNEETDFCINCKAHLITKGWTFKN